MTNLRGYSDSDIAELIRRVSDLESRVRRSAVAVPKRQGAALATARPPKIAGLSALSVVGQVGATWTPTSIADLEVYEVEIALTASFSGSVIAIDVTEPRFTYPVEDLSRPYWMRVRTRSQSTGAGAWSDALELVTGLVQASAMAPDAATAAVVYQTDEFFPALVDSEVGPVQADWGDAPVEASNGVVFVNVRLEALLGGSWSGTDRWGIDVDLLRDGEVVRRIQTIERVQDAFTFFESVENLGGLVADVPGAGLFYYGVRVTVRGLPLPAAVAVAPRRLEIETIEVMRWVF